MSDFGFRIFHPPARMRGEISRDSSVIRRPT